MSACEPHHRQKKHIGKYVHLNKNVSCLLKQQFPVLLDYLITFESINLIKTMRFSFKSYGIHNVPFLTRHKPIFLLGLFIHIAQNTRSI